jgi:hypothetical protein
VNLRLLLWLPLLIACGGTSDGDGGIVPDRDAGAPAATLDGGGVDAGRPDAGTPPVLEGVLPPGPANDNRPWVRGRSGIGETIRLHTDAACATPAVADGTVDGEGTFTIAVRVEDDTTTTLWASNGVCSTTSATYVEDSTPPAPPRIVASAPESPADDTTPTFFGETEPHATVRLFLDGECTEGPVATVEADDAGAFAAEVTVPASRRSELSAHGTDAAGNRSACGPAFGYAEADDAIAFVFPPTSAFATDEPSLTVRGRVRDGEDVVRVALGDREVDVVDGGFTMPDLPLADRGRQVLAFELVDGFDRRTPGPALRASWGTFGPGFEPDLAFRADGDRFYLDGFETDGRSMRRLAADEPPYLDGPVWDDVRERLYQRTPTGLRWVDPETDEVGFIDLSLQLSGPAAFDGVDTVYALGRRRLGDPRGTYAIDVEAGTSSLVEALDGYAFFAWDPTRRRLVVYDLGRRAYLSIDPVTGSEEVVSGEGRGRGPGVTFSENFAVDPVNDVLFVGAELRDSQLVDLATGDRRAVVLDAGLPRKPAFDPRNEEIVFTSNADRDALFRYDAASGTLRVQRLLRVGDGTPLERPLAIEEGPDGDLAYVDTETGVLVTIDVATGIRTTVLEGLDRPVGLARDAALWMVREADGEVRFSDGGGFDTGEPASPGNHAGLVADPGGDVFFTGTEAFIGRWRPGDATPTVVSSLDVGFGPTPMGDLPRGLARAGDGQLYVASSLGLMQVDPGTGDRTALVGPMFGELEFQGLGIVGDELWAANGSFILRLALDGPSGGNEPVDGAQDFVARRDDHLVFYVTGRARLEVYDLLSRQQVVIAR